MHYGTAYNAKNVCLCKHVTESNCLQSKVHSFMVWNLSRLMNYCKINLKIMGSKEKVPEGHHLGCT